MPWRFEILWEKSKEEKDRDVWHQGCHFIEASSAVSKDQQRNKKEWMFPFRLHWQKINRPSESTCYSNFLFRGSKLGTQKQMSLWWQVCKRNKDPRIMRNLYASGNEGWYGDCEYPTVYCYKYKRIPLHKRLNAFIILEKSTNPLKLKKKKKIINRVHKVMSGIGVSNMVPSFVEFVVLASSCKRKISQKNEDEVVHRSVCTVEFCFVLFFSTQGSR